MIVIGVDVHKHSLTAVAVDEVGRPLAERSGPLDDELLAWARSLPDDRLLWAVEDCRHVSRRFEQLLSARPDTRQVGCDRRARSRPCRPA
jgi:transposase